MPQSSVTLHPGVECPRPAAAPVGPRRTLPLPNEITTHILDMLDDPDVLRWRGVNKTCQMQAEDAHQWYRRARQRAYLPPVPSVAWSQADMLAHYRGQSAFVDLPLINFAQRSVVVTHNPNSIDDALRKYPATLPELRISCGDGGKIPWVVQTWPNLRRLEITQMTSTFAPEYLGELSKLPHLESLIVAGFGLWSLSGRMLEDTARVLPHLKELRIEGGMLTGVDLKPLVGMKQLRTLALRDMPELKRFAADMQPMPQVTSLDLSCVEMSSRLSLDMLRDIVRVFPHLTELKLASRNVDDAADLAVLGALPLVALDLSSTDITTIPDALCTPALQRLHLSSNDYFKLPARAEAMQGLVEIDLSNTDIAMLPASIAKMASLRKIDLSGNYGLRINASLRNLTQLHTLDLGDCDLRRLPAAVLDARSLKRLRLYGNKLAGLPLRFDRLTKLTHLDLRGNERMWPAMPRGLRHTRTLTWLALPPRIRRDAVPRLATFFPNLRYLLMEDEPVWVDDDNRVRTQRPWSGRDVERVMRGSTNVRIMATDGMWIHYHREALHAAGVRPRITYSSNFNNTWNWQ